MYIAHCPQSVPSLLPWKRPLAVALKTSPRTLPRKCFLPSILKTYPSLKTSRAGIVYESSENIVWRLVSERFHLPKFQQQILFIINDIFGQNHIKPLLRHCPENVPSLLHWKRLLAPALKTQPSPPAQKTFPLPHSENAPFLENVLGRDSI